MSTPCETVSCARLKFDDLEMWEKADFRSAFSVFNPSAKLPKCPRRFFEDNFEPWLITDGSENLITGYYEPELKGSLEKTAEFTTPIHTAPNDTSRPWATRHEIWANDLLRGREIAYLTDRVEAFFLQVQGSGRIVLTDGSMLRVGYADRNGHPYTSIGAALIAQGIFDQANITSNKIKKWLRNNPKSCDDILCLNESYVFFKILETDPNEGPIGTAGKPLTPSVSIAVDTKFIPLGTPVFVEGEYGGLKIAQDTGSAIKGAQRVDIFCGTGDSAGEIAGSLKARGRIVVLLPKAER